MFLVSFSITIFALRGRDAERERDLDLEWAGERE